MTPPPRLRVAWRLAALALALCVLPSALAFSPPRSAEHMAAVHAQLEKVDPAAAARLSLSLRGPDPLADCTREHSSTVWMCISTILVLGMSPALALFEAGMLRSKSTVSLITQIFAGVITLSVLWVLVGYTLTFGPSQGGIIGNLSNAFLIDVSFEECSPHAPQIPQALFAMFQMMFAVITPLLMTGAFAERLKFRVYMAFIVLWQIVVYYPLAHWIWGGGFLGTWGVLDFAGGIVIHTSAGAGSLVTALYLGRRANFFDFFGEFPPSNLPLAATGAALLWIGWFGFNGGSALQSGPVAVSAIVSTQIGCSTGALTWLVLSWWKSKPASSALMNGALAGLAGITPASGYINTPATIVLGVLFGLASFYSVVLMKHHLHVDDALDVSSVHGLTGVLGSLGLGLFAQLRLNPAGADGAFYGHAMQLVYQLVGVLVALVWAGAWTFALLKLLDRLTPGGIRAGEDEEEVGLDWAEHREIAYHKLHVLDDVSVAEQPLYHGMGGEDGHAAGPTPGHVGFEISLQSPLLHGQAAQAGASEDVALSSVGSGGGLVPAKDVPSSSASASGSPSPAPVSQGPRAPTATRPSAGARLPAHPLARSASPLPGAAARMQMPDSHNYKRAEAHDH